MYIYFYDFRAVGWSMEKTKLGAGDEYESGIETAEVVLGPKQGAENVVFYRTVHAPGEISEPEQHVHDIAEDIIIILEGEGEMIIGEERERVAVEEDDILLIPPGERHGTVNTGEEPLVRLTCHAPPDPNDYGISTDSE